MVSLAVAFCNSTIARMLGSIFSHRLLSIIVFAHTRVDGCHAAGRRALLECLVVGVVSLWVVGTANRAQLGFRSGW